MANFYVESRDTTYLHLWLNCGKRHQFFPDTTYTTECSGKGDNIEGGVHINNLDTHSSGQDIIYVRTSLSNSDCNYSMPPAFPLESGIFSFDGNDCNKRIWEQYVELWIWHRSELRTINLLKTNLFDLA